MFLKKDPESTLTCPEPYPLQLLPLVRYNEEKLVHVPLNIKALRWYFLVRLLLLQQQSKEFVVLQVRS